MELDGTRPLICYENRMIPICGNSFWGNNNGARLFCRMLGKSDGVVEKAKERLSEDAYVVGKCSGGDTSLTGCTGECNKNGGGGKIGGNCWNWGKSCNKGSRGGPKLTCIGKIICFLKDFTLVI